MTSSISILDGSIEIPLSYFAAKSHTATGDTVIVSGTLIEGIGNSKSDIDCLVLCGMRPKISEIPADAHVSISDESYNPNAKDAELHNTYDFFGDSGIHVDFDYVLFSEVDRLVKKVNDAFEDLRNDQRIIYEPIMTTKEDRFMHRLFVAVPAVNPAVFEDLRVRIPFDKYRYVSARELAANFYYFQDVQGTWEAGEWQMAQETTRELLITQLRSFMQMAGLTNKHRKWLYSCVKQLPEEDRRLAQCVADHLLQLGSDKAAARVYIVTAMRLLDQLFERGTMLQASNEIFPDAAECVAQLEAEFAKRNQTDHALSMNEFEFRLKALRPADTRPLEEMTFC